MVFLLVMFLSACKIPWLSQRYHHLQKIAVSANAELKSETDSIQQHFQQWKMESASALKIHDTSKTEKNLQPKTVTCESIKQASLISFVDSQFNWIKQRHFQMKPMIRQNASLAHENNETNWIISLIIGIVLLIAILMVLAGYYGNESGTGCMVLVIIVLLISFIMSL